MRTALRFALGLVVGGNYVWCLVIVAIFTGFGQAGERGVGDTFRAISWGGNACHKQVTLFIGKGVSHYVLLLY